MHILKKKKAKSLAVYYTAMKDLLVMFELPRLEKFFRTQKCKYSQQVFARL